MAIAVATRVAEVSKVVVACAGFRLETGFVRDWCGSRTFDPLSGVGRRNPFTRLKWFIGVMVFERKNGRYANSSGDSMVISHAEVSFYNATLLS